MKRGGPPVAILQERDLDLLDTLAGLKYITVDASVGTYFQTYQAAARRLAKLATFGHLSRVMCPDRYAWLYGLPGRRQPPVAGHTIATVTLWKALKTTGRLQEFLVEAEVSPKIRSDASIRFADHFICYEFEDARSTRTFIDKVRAYEEWIRWQEAPPLIVVQSPRAKQLRAVALDIIKQQGRWIIGEEVAGDLLALHQPSTTTTVRWKC